jgi:hypothetical protein
MLFKKIFPLIMISAGLSNGSAWASRDIGCTSSWTVQQAEYNHCNNLPVLAPGNDTRVNFSILLADEDLGVLQETTIKERTSGYGQVPFPIFPSFYNGIAAKKKTHLTSVPPAEEQRNPGLGSRCVSNITGKSDFINAVRQDRNLPAEEQQLLIRAREELNSICADRLSASAASLSPDVPNISSQTGKQFLQYLTAAVAFYAGKYNEAASGFSALMDSEQPWLKEAARYMIGRTELNRAQQYTFNNYGFPISIKINAQKARSLEEKFNKYLAEYPNGRYAASAKGLLRRVYWFSKQREKLTGEYIWQLNNPDSPQCNMSSLNDLVLEVDMKLLRTSTVQQITNPLLLAVLDLSLMRSIHHKQQISFTDLEKQEPLFSKHKELYQYLLAAHLFYVQNNPEAVLNTLPKSVPEQLTYLDLSRLVLRGSALEATKDHFGARELWLKLLSAAQQPLQSEMVQLALAINYEQSKETEKVFAENSPITDQAFRNRLIRNIASASLLRKIIAQSTSSQERQVALHTLLFKGLLQGHYQEVTQDFRLLTADALQNNVPPESNEPLSGLDPDDQTRLALFTWSGKKTADSISCPSLPDLAGRLTKNPQDALGMICLGDFINTNNLDDHLEYILSENLHVSSSDDTIALGATQSDFSGPLFSRGEAYKTIIADKKAAPDLKAYALYRAIKCYASTGINHCGGTDVEASVRASWFQTLKKRYKSSVWAKRLKYYW